MLNMSNLSYNYWKFKTTHPKKFRTKPVIGLSDKLGEVDRLLSKMWVFCEAWDHCRLLDIGHHGGDFTLIYGE